MRLVTFRFEGSDHVGALREDGVVRLAAARAADLHAQGMESAYELAAAELPDDMLGFLAGGERAMESARRAAAFVENRLAAEREPRGPRGERLLLPLAEVALRAPVPRPGKVMCIGLNYRDHAEEAGMKLPDQPTLFTKFPSCVIGPDASIVLPTISNQVDFEAELAVVIGKTARRVAEEQALEYVAGYAMMNDVSARDVQLADSQWTRGKSLDTFAPLGPALVTRDEVPDPQALDIALRLNGRTMQSSNTRHLVFGVARLVSFFSQAITLEPGDVISTGTPSGVGYSRVPPVYLKPGDVVEVEVQGLGVLRNPVVAPEP